MRAWGAGLGLTLCACATQPPTVPATDRGSTDLDSAIREHVRADEGSSAVSRRMAPVRDMRVLRIQNDDRPLPPLGRKSRVTVRFEGADLGDALRFLADTGQFAMVAEGQLNGKVSADMTRVVPYDALIALAEAHGARVERHGRIVVVTGGGNR